MAVSCVRVGRPPLVAKIDFSKDVELDLADELHKACADFHYAEIMALSRAFQVSISTVENWKYGLTLPRVGIAKQVIDWVAQGKPMIKDYQDKSSMLE